MNAAVVDQLMIKSAESRQEAGTDLRRLEAESPLQQIVQPE